MRSKSRRLARVTSGGMTDPSFDATGVEHDAIGTGAASGNAVTTDSQDRIVAAGTSFNGAHNVFTVARYNAGPNNPAAERTYVCAVIHNMIASGFGRWTANASALCR